MTQTPRKWLPFLDWHDIWPGATGYDPDGRAWISEAPSGVRLSIQQAQKSAPLIVNDRPWEGAVLGGGVTVLQDGGRYRMWYCSGLQGGGLCYAESEDGFAWRKPHLGLIERDGSADNNLVYPHGVAGNIFRDPSADEAERYKLVDLDSSWVHQGKDIPEPEALRLREALLNASSTQEEIEQQLSVRGAVYGAVSPDGLRWTRIAEPLFTMFCDTQNIVHYDEQSQRYVGHWRASAGRRRSIARSETADFRHWPLPEIVLQPDGQTPPTDDYYTNGYARYPGKSDLHLMFPSVYHRATDTVDVQLAISRDGFNWSWPERRPIVGMGPSGSGESGWVYAGCGLHALGSDQWGLIYDGGDVRHNVSYYAQPAGKDGQIRWALWQRDSRSFMQRDGDRLHYFARVFAPSGFRHRVMIRWEIRLPATGEWTTTDRIPLDLVGGRTAGFRGTAVKANFMPGRWRISAETEDGRAIATLSFRVEQDTRTGERRWKRIGA